jgi:hypothetical protein
MNWFEHLNNSYQIKKSLFNLMPERYHANEQIIERLGSLLVLESDIKAFFKLIGDAYELGYLKSVNDHREQLEKIGLIARVRPQDSKDG